MRHVALLLVAGGLSACAESVRVAPASPPPVAESPSPSPATDDGNVDPAPEVMMADPEEVTATTEPPDPVYEEPSEQPSDSLVWVPGYWGWTGPDWAWYSGRWLGPPEGRVYIAPYYERVGSNVVYVGGYWGLHDAPPRSYGGDRIVFAAAIRPANYRVGEYVHIGHRAGSPPGARPASAYAHATGIARPLPQARASFAQSGQATRPAPAHVATVAHPVAAAHTAPVGHPIVAAHVAVATHPAAPARPVQVHAAPVQHSAPAPRPAPAPSRRK
jgi:hypothetical protein